MGRFSYYFRRFFQNGRFRVYIQGGYVRRCIIMLLDIICLRSPYAVKNHCNLLVQTCFMLCHCLSFRLNILLCSLHFKRNILVGGRLTEGNYYPFTILTSPSLKHNIMYQFKRVKIISFFNCSKKRGL
jgi:hypothetical protein